MTSGSGGRVDRHVCELGGRRRVGGRESRVAGRREESYVVGRRVREGRKIVDSSRKGFRSLLIGREGVSEVC